jgi:two-component system phosphate regulon response regulator PhoB
MSKQIMLVDDEVVMLALLGMTMKRGGFTVIEAESAAMALELLEATTPDLIILDLMMPGIDGVELCRRIRAREQTADVPIVMLSALNDAENMKRALAAGANDYLSKLTPHREVLAKVHLLLGTNQPGKVI